MDRLQLAEDRSGRHDTEGPPRVKKKHQIEQLQEQAKRLLYRSTAFADRAQAELERADAAEAKAAELADIVVRETERAEGWRAEVEALKQSLRLAEGQVADLTRTIGDMKQPWRPIPVSHQWEPRDGRCRFCDDPRGHARHTKPSAYPFEAMLDGVPPVCSGCGEPLHRQGIFGSGVAQCLNTDCAFGPPGDSVRTPAEEHAMEQLEREG
jgi:acyl-CoA reductase-like NAD-dependent aldehyde dehydrogenase